MCRPDEGALAAGAVSRRRRSCPRARRGVPRDPDGAHAAGTTTATAGPTPAHWQPEWPLLQQHRTSPSAEPESPRNTNELSLSGMAHHDRGGRDRRRRRVARGLRVRVGSTERFLRKLERNTQAERPLSLSLTTIHIYNDLGSKRNYGTNYSTLAAQPSQSWHLPVISVYVKLN
jgi:hypothetical protein